MAQLKIELRSHIRLLGDYDFLSADWFALADSLHQVANVALMETFAGLADDNPLAQKGKKETGTLWDQEKDEVAIRILLEEGKLNLALRLLHKYRLACRDKNFQTLIAETAKKYGTDAPTVLDRCRIFEHSLGMLLKLAVQHVEALQILDVPELVLHCKEVMDESAGVDQKTAVADFEKMQENLIFYYLQSLTSKMEDMDEDRIMELFENHEIIKTAASFLGKQYIRFKIDGLITSAKFLSNAMGSEAFVTEQKRFIPNNEVAQQLVALKGLFLSELQTGYGLKRKDVQKLLDVVDRLELKVGKSPAGGPLRDKLLALQGK